LRGQFAQAITGKLPFVRVSRTLRIGPGKTGEQSMRRSFEEARHHWAQADQALAACAALMLTAAAIHPSHAAETAPVRMAVFDFELDDRSAAGGVIAKDAIDDENLKKSTEGARQRLEASGRYAVVDTATVAGQLISVGGVQSCNGCEATLAEKLGADQSMSGVFARVSRTEYTLQVVIRDARTGAVLSNTFSGLRMGANYAWPRAVTSVLDNKILQ
jgi:Protein of unknown function (DUF2380)